MQQTVPLILVAEDNEANRDLIRRRLMRRGFEVLVVCNGREAVDILDQIRPDVILTDLEMPIMSGFDAMEAIQQRPEYSSIPVVALTAHATQAIRSRCQATGFDAFVTKPIDFPRLIERLEHLGINAPTGVTTVPRQVAG